MREFYRQRDRHADLQPIDLNTLAGQVIEMTRARWHDVPQERGVVIRTHMDLARDLPKVMGIESDVRDALTNLIFNAVDAMPAGGALGIRTCSGPRRAAEVDLEVSDTGAGMDEETRRRCLEPFFTTKGERGTGMGLAMVYGTMKRHGGQVDIDSAPGRGTTVRLSFVAATVSAGSHVHEPAPARWPRPLRLLVIDDDPLVGRSLSQVLSSEGHVVTLADGGQAGIDAFSAAHQRMQGGEPFDIVITDLGMPYVDGRAVAAAVKVRSASTPVLLLTGWGQRLTTENSVPANVDCVLSKPPKLPELRRAFVDLLSGRVTLEGA
jgi:CheY-like chemotaxis protein